MAAAADRASDSSASASGTDHPESPSPPQVCCMEGHFRTGQRVFVKADLSELQAISDASEDPECRWTPLMAACAGRSGVLLEFGDNFVFVQFGSGLEMLFDPGCIAPLSGQGAALASTSPPRAPRPSSAVSALGGSRSVELQLSVLSVHAQTQTDDPLDVINQRLTALEREVSQLSAAQRQGQQGAYAGARADVDAEGDVVRVQSSI
eukprot:TRINITY_DN14275_c0_g1_i1.p1 TRINITY_DN14275_c0_g1~~TRINITY_DN14275_c0_g1_i1.p1  ORF type:complete len:232 (+),score=79.94 TRINITY_DN14275_c0_g1_i1:77-697(+)